jgi:hypothetical protein
VSLPAVLAACEPETTPEREGWRIMLGVAHALAPDGGLDPLVDLAIGLGPGLWPPLGFEQLA